MVKYIVVQYYEELPQWTTVAIVQIEIYILRQIVSHASEPFLYLKPELAIFKLDIPYFGAVLMWI